MNASEEKKTAVAVTEEESGVNKQPEVEEDEDVDDVLSLEKILSTELKNVSASFVTWQSSPDKKYKLCIFYVRFSNILIKVGSGWDKNLLKQTYILFHI